MEVTVCPRGLLQINNARIIFRNFSGEEGQFNREGERSFSLVIAGGTFCDGVHKPIEVDAQEMAEALMAQTNMHGVGWNIKIKPPRTEEEDPFMHMKVKVSTKNRMPAVYLSSAGNVRRLEEGDLWMLDEIAIRNVNLDIRPFDGEMRGEGFRSAYLDSIEVIQEIDRFTARYAEEESPEE